MWTLLIFPAPLLPPPPSHSPFCELALYRTKSALPIELHAHRASIYVIIILDVPSMKVGWLENKILGALHN